MNPPLEKVSCRNLLWLLDALPERGIEASELLAGVGFDEKHLRDPNRFVDWDTVMALCDTFGRGLSPDEVEAFGRRSLRHSSYRILTATARLVFDTVDGYRFVFRPADGLLVRDYPQLRTSIGEVGPGALRLEVLARRPFTPSPVWLRLLAGQIRAIPGLLGFPEADVEMTETEHGAAYRVRYRPHRAPLSALRRAVSLPFSAPGIARNLLATVEILEEKNRHLEAEVERREKAEATLAGNEARYRFLTESVRDVIWASTLDLQFTYVSPAAREVLGYPWGETATVRPGEGITESSYLRAVEIVERELAREREPGVDPSRSFTTEIELRTSDGEERFAEVNVCFTRDASGEPSGLLGVTRDITERRKAAEQLRQAQRTESIGHLAAGVAHDFNNLLVAIQGYTELCLRSDEIPARVRDYLGEVQHASERAKSLTEQLLAFGRKQRIEILPIDLSELVLGLRPMLERLLPANIQQEFELEAGTIVSADPRQIEQVVVNLALNARDSMPDGGRLRFETGRVEIDREAAARHQILEADGFSVLRVSDTGSGIAPAVQARIFDPFFTTKPPGTGSGLGLSVAHGVVSQHGGFIDLTSRPGAGSSFAIYLPRVESDAPVAIRKEQGDDSPIRGGTEAILVVEDEDVVREVTREFLGAAGYTVRTARDGDEAIAAFAAEPEKIDLVLMDVMMPKMSGPEVRAKLRILRPDVPVLYASGYVDDDGRSRLADSDIEILPKPYSQRTLLRRVRRILDRQAGP